MSACSDVPAGHVGIKVYMLGNSRGVDHEVLSVGRYYIGLNEQLYLFPTFQQNYVWTKSQHEGKPVDESITFQTKEGMDVGVDVGISYHLQGDKVADIFQKYRKPIDEITDIFLRKAVRDSIVRNGSNLSVEEIYGNGKATLFNGVKKDVADKMKSEGILVDDIYLVGSPRLPQNVVAALNSKIEATQRAQQRENEVQEARAQAQKEIAQAEGQAQATLTKAKAEADSNKLKQASLTPTLIQYETVTRWNGQLPMFTGGNNSTMLVNPDMFKAK